MLTNSIWGDIKHYFRYGNMVVKLIFVNVGVFLFFGILSLIDFLAKSNLHDIIYFHGALWSIPQVLMYQPWAFFTYMFMHDGVWHILFNMLWLYWFGEIFVLYMGDKKILPLYIIGGLAGGLLFVLSYNFIPAFKPMQGQPLVGASAAILAIVFAAATINPDHEVGLVLLGTVKIKYIAIVPLIINILSIPYGNAGGYIAHVGGAISGYFYIMLLRQGFNISNPFNSFLKLFKRSPKVKVSYKNTAAKSSDAKRNSGDQEKVDEILDKIARSGYDSLSKEERDFLFHFSKK